MENQIPVAPTQPIVNTQQAVIPEQPKKNNFLTILLSIFLFLAIVIAIFFAYQTQKLSKELDTLRLDPESTFPMYTEPNELDDPTVDWETYNKKSFSVKTPRQLIYNERTSNEDLLSLGEALPEGKTPEKGIDISFGYMYGIEIIKCATNNDCFDNINTSIKGAESAGSKTITTLTSTIILGQTIKSFRHVDSPSDTFSLTQVRLIYPISHNGNLFEIQFNAFGKSETEINQYLDTLNIDQILSTFKFLD